MLYAAAGARLWGVQVGLLSRVGEDYPRNWRAEFLARGLDTDGIRTLPGGLDLRSFKAYSEDFQLQSGQPVAQFARRKMDFPKALLGYSATQRVGADESGRLPHLPTVGDIPEAYLEAVAVHVCPMDFTSQAQLLSAFKTGSVRITTLDPGRVYMLPEFARDLGGLLNGLTAFLPASEEALKLYWGQSDDLWEIAEDLGKYGPELVVIKCGGRGQMLYDVPGRRRWEIPAYPARVADPTGMGDAFGGGFLAGYRATYDPLEAALHGNVAASLNVEGSGAFYPLEVMPGLAQARLEVVRGLVRRV